MRKLHGAFCPSIKPSGDRREVWQTRQAQFWPKPVYCCLSISSYFVCLEEKLTSRRDQYESRFCLQRASLCACSFLRLA